MIDITIHPSTFYNIDCLDINSFHLYCKNILNMSFSQNILLATKSYLYRKSLIPPKLDSGEPKLTKEYANKIRVGRSSFNLLNKGTSDSLDSQSKKRTSLPEIISKSYDIFLAAGYSKGKSIKKKNKIVTVRKSQMIYVDIQIGWAYKIIQQFISS